jgi:ureidoacrylate peracid hydrolase
MLLELRYERIASVLTFEEILDPETTAILVVDMQKDFCTPSDRKGSWTTVDATEEMIPRLQRFLDEARALQGKIIFIKSVHEPSTDTDVWLRRHGGVPRLHCRPGTPGVEFYGVAPQGDELVVIKHRYSGFIGTRLETVLHAMRIRTVVMTGVATNVCVESTARDAYQRDFNVVLLSDCTATRNLQTHEAALENIRRNFGDVSTANDVLNVWRGAVVGVT